MRLETNTLPEGVELSETGSAVFSILSRYTVFGWAVLKAQCDRVGISPAALSARHLEMLIPYLARGVSRFTSPTKGMAVEADLGRLLRAGAERRPARPNP